MAASSPHRTAAGGDRLSVNSNLASAILSRLDQLANLRPSSSTNLKHHKRHGPDRQNPRSQQDGKPQSAMTSRNRLVRIHSHRNPAMDLVDLFAVRPSFETHGTPLLSGVAMRGERTSSSGSLPPTNRSRDTHQGREQFTQGQNE